MKRILLAALSAAALAAITSSVTVTPAEAHHPSYIWYNGYKYWAADYYRRGYCFYHHGYIYCRGGGGGGGGGGGY